MSKEMLEYNQDLMDQAKQMISGGKYKKKAGDSVKKREVPKKIQNKKTKLSKKANLALNLGIFITVVHVSLCLLTIETVSTPSANGYGGFAEFLAFIVFWPLVIAWIMELVAFCSFLFLYKKQKKSKEMALKIEAEDKKRDVTLTLTISIISMIVFWVLFFILLSIH